MMRLIGVVLLIAVVALLAFISLTSAGTLYRNQFQNYGINVDKWLVAAGAVLAVLMLVMLVRGKPAKREGQPVDCQAPSGADQQALQEIGGAAERMEERIESLETILIEGEAHSGRV